MKTIKGKYIRLTEPQLNQLIENEVHRVVQQFMEYSHPRAKYVENVSNLSKQIIENWCLVRYCTIVGRTTLKEHWQNELYAHMANIGQDTIKGNKSYETKYKAIADGFEMKDLFDGPEKIFDIIYKKFTIEKIDVKSDEVVQTINDCSNSLDAIINAMADFGAVKLDDYIKSI